MYIELSMIAYYSFTVIQRPLLLTPPLDYIFCNPLCVAFKLGLACFHDPLICSGLIAARELGLAYPELKQRIFVVSSIYYASRKVNMFRQLIFN